MVLLGGCSFGILSTFVKLAYRKGLSLADVTSAQAYFGAAILWLFLVIFKVSKRSRPENKSLQLSVADGRMKSEVTVSTALRLILTGMASGAISICYYKCVEHMAASVAIILLMQYTWMHKGTALEQQQRDTLCAWTKAEQQRITARTGVAVPPKKQGGMHAEKK